MFIIDDDADLREALADMLSSVGLEPQEFATAAAFLAAPVPVGIGCALIDVRMPIMNGMTLIEALIARQFPFPVIMVTGHGDVATAVQAMKLGAFDFIEKPVDPELFIEKVQIALKHCVETRTKNRPLESFATKLATLSEREQEVLDLIVEGHTSKMVAEALGISPYTVDNHRAKIIQKTEAESLAQLIKLVCALRERRAG